MDYGELENKIEELEKLVSEKNKDFLELKDTVVSLKRLLETHQHSRIDGTSLLSKGIDVESGQPVYIGNGGIIELTTGIDQSTENNNLTFAAGRDRGAPSGGTKENTANTNIFIQHQPGTDGSTNQTFMFGYRPPLYKNTSTSIEATSGGTTFTDPSQNWTTNELAGAHLVVSNSSGTFQYSRQIASNTATVITIDGTFPSTVTSSQYTVLMPIYFGGAQYPWRQGYFGGEDVSSGGTGAQRRVLRLGYGTTAGADVIGIYFGTGDPESVVTANIGSLFLRTDGGAGTVLYVKESGNGANTGWSSTA